MSDRTFWVLERDGRYVSMSDVETTQGGFVRHVDWTDDIKEARHFPTQQYADDLRRSLGHPFWMSDPVQHAWISPDAYADGLAAEITTLRAQAEAMVGALDQAIGRSEWVRSVYVVDGCEPSFDDYVSLAQSVKSAIATYRASRKDAKP
jgi:hypothetical protein